METIGQRLRALRVQRGLSQEEVAKATGITRGNISNYELDRFKPSTESIVRLASFFNVSVDWLLTGKGNSPVPNKTDGSEERLLRKYHSLPRALQAEVLDFVEFLTEKKGKKDKTNEK